jgi:hypothetical protein
MEAFEAWCYRRMMRIIWVDGVTNEEIFKRKEKRSLWKNFIKRKAEMIGHLLRYKGILNQ